MTIRVGGDWGAPGVPPEDLTWFDDDRSVSHACADGTTILGVRHGDLARTLGAGGAPSAVEFPLDVVRLRSSAAPSTCAVAHVVVRGRLGGWWRGAVKVVMNAQYLGEWDVAPRGHPNDGRVETFEVAAEMSVRQRWAARRRLPSGSHLPHPMIETRSVRRADLIVPPRSRVDVDGRRWFTTGRRETVEVTLEVLPDAITVWTAGADGELPLTG